MHKTYQTKLCRDVEYPTNILLVAYLDEWSMYFQSIERKLYVDMVHRKTSVSALKKEYLPRHGITARQFNSIRAQLQGKISSVRSLRKWNSRRRLPASKNLRIV